MANEKVSELPTVANATLSDITYAIQSGVSVQMNLQQISNLFGSPVDLTGTITTTGFSVLTSNVFQTIEIGKLLYINFNFSGTSNSTTFTVGSLPYVAAFSNIFIPIFVNNNGTFGTGFALVGTNTITFYSAANVSTWSSTGTKSASGSFCIQTT